jgi:hypothetical protein
MLRKVNLLKIKEIYYYRIQKQVVITTDTGLPLILTVEQLRSLLKAVDK